MIGSLEDAWNWYVNARQLTRGMQRLGSHYWDQLPQRALSGDKHLNDLDAGSIADRTEQVLDDLDDLCVLFLFSVFESNVREHALIDIELELPTLHHPALLHAVKSLKDSIDNGSFFKVLEAYKSVDANLIEEVNQVRRYRNWVAHGRRGQQPGGVTPQQAFQRLQRLLQLLSSLHPVKSFVENTAS